MRKEIKDLQNYNHLLRSAALILKQAEEIHRSLLANDYNLDRLHNMVRNCNGMQVASYMGEDIDIYEPPIDEITREYGE